MSLHTRYLKVFLQLQIARKFSSEKLCQEVCIPVPWGHIRGKWWGPTNIRPILTLHGWQDNCGSFNRLIPLLNKNVGYLAVDFPGHGLSSRLPVGIYYNFENYILAIRYIADYFGWPKVSLMGHSMGGITSYYYTMLYPKSVDFVACIDGATPLIQRKQVAYFSKTLEKFSKTNDSAIVEPPSYTLDVIKQKIHESNNNSVALEFTHHLVERNVAPSKHHPGKYYFTRGIKTGDLFSHFPETEIVENAHDITCPIFIIKSSGKSHYTVNQNFYDVLDILKKSSADFNFCHMEGTHHTHLNNPQDHLVPLLESFIQRNNTEDRSIGGIKEQSIVTDEQHFENQGGNNS